MPDEYMTDIVDKGLISCFLWATTLTHIITCACITEIFSHVWLYALCKTA